MYKNVFLALVNQTPLLTEYIQKFKQGLVSKGFNIIHYKAKDSLFKNVI